MHKDEYEGVQTITIEYKEIGELPVDAVVTIRCPENETLTYWNLKLNNGTKFWIGHIRFPVIEVPFDDLRNGDHSYILSSSLDEHLQGLSSLRCMRDQAGRAILRLSASGEGPRTPHQICG